MKVPPDHLEPFATKKCVNVVVETPKGSRVKYAYDPESGYMRLSKALPEGMVFPFNFGFIPQTRADDGDPLDMLILNEEPLVPGCLLKVRPVGVIEATQTEDAGAVRNDRIIGEAIGKEIPLDLEAVELTGRLVSQIGFFFKAYNKLYGKKFKVLGTAGGQQAMKLIERAIHSQTRFTQEKKS